MNLHYIRARRQRPEPDAAAALARMAGSVQEFHKIMPMLTDPARFGGDRRGCLSP